MRVRLAVLQFPLLYCVGVLAGLSVYGVDFGSVSGWLYLIPLLLGPALLPRLSPGVLARLRRFARLLAGTGVLLGGVAYRPLHLGFWDDRSLAQAVAVSAFGLISVVVGWLALTQIATKPGRTPPPLAGALAVVAAFLALSRWYPLITILGAALCLAPAVTLRWEAGEAPEPHRGRPTFFLGALAFYLAAEVSQVVWDLGLDSSWGPMLALTFLTAAALGATWWFAASRYRAAVGHPWFAALAGAAALVIAGAASVLTAWRPAFVLHPARQVLFGLAFGGLIVAVLARTTGNAHNAASAQNVWLSLTLGLAVSAVYSAQFEAFPRGRLAFVVPAVLAFAWERRQAARLRRPESPSPA
jgi:hypothetical protein